MNSVLEKTYDTWKLSGGKSERSVGVMPRREHVLRNNEGKCPECAKVVFPENLFVEIEHNETSKSVYHLSCYNMMKAKENDNE